jgi:hypothetical protein
MVLGDQLDQSDLISTLRTGSPGQELKRRSSLSVFNYGARNRRQKNPQRLLDLGPAEHRQFASRLLADFISVF